jgi:hypothetical protein
VNNKNQPFQLSFNPSLKVTFQGSRVTSDGGLILVRELDERLGLSGLIGQRLSTEAVRRRRTICVLPIEPQTARARKLDEPDRSQKAFQSRSCSSGQ